MCWEEKVYALNLKVIFFLMVMDMAAEGRVNTSLTCAQQLVSDFRLQTSDIFKQDCRSKTILVGLRSCR